MAKTPVNSGLKRIQGELDGWIYRVVEGETIICRPADRSSIINTSAQVTVRNRFRDAAKYARSVYEDAAKKERYRLLAEKAGVPRARLFAYVLQDYATPPTVTSVDADHYGRQIGDPIDIKAHDEGEVTGVHVTLRQQNGLLIETGPAVPYAGGYRYLGQTVVPPGPVIVAEVVAADLPGNETKFTASIRGTIPTIDRVDSSAYQGRIGDSIYVEASDDGSVSSIFVLLRSTADVELESGAAILANGRWRYLGKTPVTLPVYVDLAVNDVDGNTVEQRSILG